MKCKHWNTANPTKAEERYKSRTCTRHFTGTKPRGKIRSCEGFCGSYVHSLQLLALGMIGRAIGVSNVAVLKWF